MSLVPIQVSSTREDWILLLFYLNSPRASTWKSLTGLIITNRALQGTMHARRSESERSVEVVEGETPMYGRSSPGHIFLYPALSRLG